MKAECNAKICIVLSIAEAHPRIAICRTAKRAFGFLPKAKACLREQDTEFLKPKCNRSCGLRVALGKSGKTERQVALIVIVIVIVRRVRNLQPATHIDFPCACERVCVFLIIKIKIYIY